MCIYDTPHTHIEIVNSIHPSMSSCFKSKSQTSTHGCMYTETDNIPRCDPSVILRACNIQRHSRSCSYCAGVELIRGRSHPLTDGVALYRPNFSNTQQYMHQRLGGFQSSSAKQVITTRNTIVLLLSITCYQ